MLEWLWKRLSEGGPGATVSGRALGRFPERIVERFLRARILVEQRKADNWSVCAGCTCGLAARPIRVVGSRLVACCPLDTSEDVLLGEGDVRRFSINGDPLAEAIATSGGLNGGVRPIAEGVWSLGRAPSGRAILLSSNLEGFDAPGMILAVRNATNGAPATILAVDVKPAMVARLGEAGFDCRELREVIAADADGNQRLVVDCLEPRIRTPRLVVNTDSHAVVLDGRRLELPRQMFSLFRMLAEQIGQRDPVVKKETIEAQTGRPANEILRDLRSALVSCGLTRDEARALVVTVRGYGYRLGLDPAEVVIEG